MLLGRESEQREIERALDRARGGESATLALVGEPGIGKSALLDCAAERAADMQVLRARGVESEAHIPFGSLFELLRPTLSLMERIPQPQAAALEAALALRPGGPHERFAVGAATLNLLAACADERPVALVIDDAQWLDLPSAESVLFALRRLLADRVAAFIGVREGEPSLLDGADLPTLRLGGLGQAHALQLVPELAVPAVRRLHEATGGNPLAMLELASDPDSIAGAPEGAPLPVPERISAAFQRRLNTLPVDAARAMCLVAASDTGDLAILQRAADRLGVDLSVLVSAERAGLIMLGAGSVEFPHPLVRSAVYAASAVDTRREMHRAFAATLPDRDVDRRAWHLAAAAVGIDETASAALEQAGIRSRERTAYATASAAFERAGRLTGDGDRRSRMLLEAGTAAWDGGRAQRAVSLLDEARAAATASQTIAEIDELAGYIAAHRGPVMRGHAILVAAAERAGPERAVPMLAEAAAACFYAGQPGLMLTAANQAKARLPQEAAARLRFIVAVAEGMARIFGGDAGAGAGAIREAIELAEQAPELSDDMQLLPWLAVAPIFLRESDAGRALLASALRTARARAALGALPLVLNLIARDEATTDRWSEAEATYLEALGLARETDQRTDIGFALAGLAWLYARRGREQECRAAASEAVRLSVELGTRFHEVWATAALAELELGLGRTAAAIERFQHQRALLRELRISDPDLSPAADLVEALLRAGELDDARQLAAEFSREAAAKGQPWSLARASRCRALVADDDRLDGEFRAALRQHEQTADLFELARTQLAYGERLRRVRNRRAAREQLRAALACFEHLEARPWAERTRSELAATGETLRRRDPTSLDELTPQELQIALQLADGRTTREAAAALFISPKTVEYHLRHVYLKLGIHSRDELAEAMSSDVPVPTPSSRQS